MRACAYTPKFVQTTFILQSSLLKDVIRLNPMGFVGDEFFCSNDEFFVG